MARTTRKRFITNETGEKMAVILDIEEYRKLVEDLEDLRLIASFIGLVVYAIAAAVGISFGVAVFKPIWESVLPF